MADIDIAVLAEKYGVPINAEDPRGTMAAVLTAMDKDNQEKGGQVDGLSQETLALQASLGDAVTQIQAQGSREALAAGAGIEGKAEIEVDPGALAAEQEKRGLDPERVDQIKDVLTGARSVPKVGAQMFSTNFRREHPIHEQDAQDEVQLAMQHWNDDLYIMSRAFEVPPTHLRLWTDVLETSPAVRKMVNETPRAYWKSAGNEKLAQGVPEHERTATDALVSDSASAGGDWAPVGMSQSIFSDIRLATVVAQQLMQINMPTRTFQPPYRSGEPTTYLTSQATDQTPKAFDTGTPTLTALGFGTAMEFSTEMEEDSLAAVMPVVRQSLIEDQAESLESALINGDDGTHFDGAAVDGGSGDVRNAWDGFRFLTYTSSLTTDLNTLNVDTLRGLTSEMGKYAANPKQCFWLTGPKIRVKLLGLKDDQNNPAVLTMDKLGPNATIVTGMVASIDGMPVLISGQYPEWEDSSGAYGDSGGTPSAYTQSSIILINKGMFWLGNRRPLRIDQDRFILGDYILVVAKSRWGFAPAIACNTSYKCAWRGINMDT